MRCLTCRGVGGYCEMCGGGGVVCPTCRGMRWLRTGRVEGMAYAIERCDRCVNDDEETEAIHRYLSNWFQHHPMTPESDVNA